MRNSCARGEAVAQRKANIKTKYVNAIRGRGEEWMATSRGRGEGRAGRDEG